tara:strand:- start:189 stop:302 length:114 start_codon:yes stop_codon:yes gene_type:complete
MFETFGAQVGFMLTVTLVVAGAFAFFEWVIEQDDSDT